MAQGILQSMFSMLKWVLSLSLYALFPLSVLFAFFASSCFFWYLYYRKKGLQVPHTYGCKVKIKPLPIRVFVDFPQRFVLDLLQKDGNAFPYYGFHLFCGEQGSGKTISAIEMCRRMKQQFPKALLLTNVKCSFADAIVHSLDDIIMKENGRNGVIIFIDEIQNWFSSNESKYFPVEMLQDICQQRKQRKIIVGTSQVFDRVAKPIREQVNYLYKPITIAGAGTIVRKMKPCVVDGSVKKSRKSKIYFFVHDEELRNCFDTWERVKRLCLVGFKPRSETPYRQDEPPKADE